MTIRLNHTIVAAHDNEAAARFLAEILGLPSFSRLGPFAAVQVSTDTSLDFVQVSDEITPQHYAFLVGEEEFDAAFARIRGQDLPYWADPGRTQPGVINQRDGGRGMYFEDPDGHLLEIITRPYGSGG